MRSATESPSCVEKPNAETPAKTMFSFRVGKSRAKFPARAALGISRLVATNPIAAIVRLINPKTTGPPVSARIETKKASASATKELPASTVRRSLSPWV